MLGRWSRSPNRRTTRRTSKGRILPALWAFEWVGSVLLLRYMDSWVYCERWVLFVVTIRFEYELSYVFLSVFRNEFLLRRGRREPRGAAAKSAAQRGMQGRQAIARSCTTSFAASTAAPLGPLASRCGPWILMALPYLSAETTSGHA